MCQDLPLGATGRGQICGVKNSSMVLPDSLDAHRPNILSEMNLSEIGLPADCTATPGDPFSRNVILAFSSQFDLSSCTASPITPSRVLPNPCRPVRAPQFFPVARRPNWGSSSVRCDGSVQSPRRCDRIAFSAARKTKSTHTATAKSTLNQRSLHQH